MNAEKPWVSTVRRQSGIVEHICKCGVGHPAYGSIHWMKINGKEHSGVHACCGCCQTTEWKLADYKEGLEVANLKLKSCLDRYRMLSERCLKLERKILELVGFDELVESV